MNVQAIPRTVVTTYLSAARLPLTLAAKVSGQEENEQWPPVLAFESFEASVQTMAGSLLRDDELVKAGQLTRVKVAELRKAADLETIAQTAREQARDELSEERERADRKRQGASQRARQREQKAEHEAQQRKAKVKRKTAEKVAAAERVEQAQTEAIDRRERGVTRQALAKEKGALKAQKQALSASEAADSAGEAIDRSKAARRSA